MGGGSYSFEDRATRSVSMGYGTKSAHEIFTSKQINNAMNPHGITVRESRDSDEHPDSQAIIIALDVTGSMGSVPHFLVKEGLPAIMDSIIQKGIQDPQVLFLGIGDHECDKSPLQVGQFESSDELLDKWLTDIYLEGGGGGNKGESYMLAWYFAAMHTAIDCFEKRGKKGFLFTVGDEPVLDGVSANRLKNLMGPGQYEDYSSSALIERAMERYEVYHININETFSGSRQEVTDGWRQLLADRLILADRKENVAGIISNIVTASQQTSDPVSLEDVADSKEEMIL